MDRVVFIAFDRVQTLDVAGPAEVFAAAGRIVGRRRYELVYASVGGGQRETTADLRVRTADLRHVRPRPRDVVLVAGGDGVGVRAASEDRALHDWLRRAHRVVRIIGSVCSGAFVLAAAGLLDGHRVATHWAACAELARRYPSVTVDSEAIFVQDRSVWTSAGVTAGIDMALAILEGDHGRALADAVAGRLVLYVRRPGFQSQFSDALVAQVGGDDAIARAIRWARTHLDAADVGSVARHAGLSVRTLHRRCLQVLRMTPARLVDRLRVERARAVFRPGLSLKEVARVAGFTSTVQLNRAFRREVGLSARAWAVLHAGPPNQPSTYGDGLGNRA